MRYYLYLSLFYIFSLSVWWRRGGRSPTSFTYNYNKYNKYNKYINYNNYNYKIDSISKTRSPARPICLCLDFSLIRLKLANAIHTQPFPSPRHHKKQNLTILISSVRLWWTGALISFLRGYRGVCRILQQNYFILYQTTKLYN